MPEPTPKSVAYHIQNENTSWAAEVPFKSCQECLTPCNISAILAFLTNESPRATFLCLINPTPNWFHTFTRTRSLSYVAGDTIGPTRVLQNLRGQCCSKKNNNWIQDATDRHVLNTNYCSLELELALPKTELQNLILVCSRRILCYRFTIRSCVAVCPPISMSRDAFW